MAAVALATAHTMRLEVVVGVLVFFQFDRLRVDGVRWFTPRYDVVVLSGTGTLT